MSGENFEYMDGDSAFGMFEGLDFEQVLELEGGALAGMFGAMEHGQIIGMGGEQLYDVALAMTGEHFQYMDGDSAFGMFEGLVFEQGGCKETSWLACSEPWSTTRS